MKKLIFTLVLILMAILIFYPQEETPPPHGVYISNMIDRDTLYILKEVSPKDSVKYNEYVYRWYGNYERHIFSDDSLRIHKGTWVYDSDFKNVLMYDWVSYGEFDPNTKYGSVYKNDDGFEYTILTAEYGWRHNIKGFWLGSCFGSEKYVRVK